MEKIRNIRHISESTEDPCVFAQVLNLVFQGLISLLDISEEEQRRLLALLR
jgi:hypothetical protein